MHSKGISGMGKPSIFCCSSVKKGKKKKKKKKNLTPLLSQCCDCRKPTMPACVTALADWLWKLPSWLMLEMWLKVIEEMKSIFEISFRDTERLPTFSVCYCRSDSFINHPLVPRLKQHLLTLRHVGIFLILSQWMRKKRKEKNIPHMAREGWGSRK